MHAYNQETTLLHIQPGSCYKQFDKRSYHIDIQTHNLGPQMRLESLPKIDLLTQSDTTKTLVRQLTCLLNTLINSSSYLEFKQW